MVWRIIYAIAGIYFFLAAIKVAPAFMDIDQVLAFTGLRELVTPTLLIPYLFLLVMTALFFLFLFNTVWHFSSPGTYATNGGVLLGVGADWLNNIIIEARRRVGSVILALLLTGVLDVLLFATGLFTCVTVPIPGGTAESCPPVDQVVLLLIASIFMVWAIAPKSLYPEKKRTDSAIFK